MDGWHGYHTKHEMCYREMLRFYLLKIATQQQKNPHSTTTVSGVEQLLNKSRFKMLQMKAWGSFDWYV